MLYYNVPVAQLGALQQWVTYSIGTYMASTFPRKVHDHRGCVTGALRDAELVCKERGVRLTRIRKRVLEVIWREHKPIGAYQILDILRSERSGDTRRAEPPTVYRALEFLLENGLVHRIESQNAYVGCCYPNRQHDGVFLICQTCGTAGEVPSPAINDALANIANESGFSLNAISLEAIGECPDCRQQSVKAP